jgi:hypothetical protein
MKNKLILTGIIVFAVVIIGFFVWTYWGMDSPSKTKHETNAWAVIKDPKEDIIAIETTNPSTWETLVNLRSNQTQMWIGGLVEEYANYWGFRFNPNTIVLAQITIEGAQSNIQGISGDLNYWINIWAKQAYVLAKVVEIHENEIVKPIEEVNFFL